MDDEALKKGPLSTGLSFHLCLITQLLFISWLLPSYHQNICVSSSCKSIYMESLRTEGSAAPADKEDSLRGVCAFSFPSTHGEQSCPDSASYAPREQSKIVTTGMTCRLLTSYYVPCFELPRKPLTFMEGILHQRLLQKSCSCETSLTRVIPGALLCSYPGFLANPERPPAGPGEAAQRSGVFLTPIQ